MTLTNDQIADQLNGIEPGKLLGPKLHNALLRLTVSVAIEAVAFRERSPGKIEVLLRQRGPNEAAYPGQWHCPGSFIRPEERLEDVFERLHRAETLGRTTQHNLVGNFFWEEERGTICSAVYLVTLQDVPATAQWFPVDGLPEPMVAHHREAIIPEAFRAFRSSLVAAHF